MKILTVLTYYRPHTSGLTIFVERLCEAFVKQGHEVTVLTSQFDKTSAREEIVNGVRIVRAPVWFRISKGVIMPTIGFLATREVLKHDVIHLHLPQFDAPGIALRGKLFRKPTVLTYHSDLTLPAGLFNRIVNQVIFVMNFFAAKLSDRIGAYTEDFAKHSFYLSKYLDKIEVITPPVELPTVTDEAIKSFASNHNPDKKHPIIGMATRFAAEKGVEVLLDALPKILDKHPNAKVLFAGQFEDVLGEEAYLARLMPTIEKYQTAGQWEFLGVLTLEEIAAFYPAIDVLLVPSLNGTETFGFVQIEAMMNGVPTVASNLPGVRQPIAMTGMGIVSEIGDADALANAVINIIENPENFKGDIAEIKRLFSPATAAKKYAALFQQLLNR
jgi:glycosyltransferase involved in cell wall biosynthesis